MVDHLLFESNIFFIVATKFSLHGSYESYLIEINYFVLRTPKGMIY